MVRSPLFLGFLLLLIGAIAVTCGWAQLAVKKDRSLQLPARIELVKRLHLTDLSIWTEARYTRHPSQADFFTPFQEFPGAPEHFPAGSLLAPPFVQRKFAAPGHEETR